MKYKIDYFGYVYMWTNIRNNKKYIGSHYGSVDDYYTGSGKAFKPAFNKNPNYFKMAVLEYLVEDNKKLLLKKEQQWLDTVPNIRENKEYYNLNNYSLGGSSHITEKHIKKRARTLKARHSANGLSDSEKNSYKTKIQTRLNRIANAGFTEREQQQHNSYGYQIKVTMLDGYEKIYDSCGKASKELGINVGYGLRVCAKKEHFKGYRIVKLRDPIIDCRNKKTK